MDGFYYRHVAASDKFASKFLLVIEINSTSIHLIGGFALRSKNEVFPIPTIVSNYWDDIPVGDPESWIKAYELMGRTKKANMLKESLRN